MTLHLRNYGAMVVMSVHWHHMLVQRVSEGGQPLPLVEASKPSASKFWWGSVSSY